VVVLVDLALQVLVEEVVIPEVVVLMLEVVAVVAVLD
jgi:hypothetical protein